MTLSLKCRLVSHPDSRVYCRQVPSLASRESLLEFVSWLVKSDKYLQVSVSGSPVLRSLDGHVTWLREGDWVVWSGREQGLCACREGEFSEIYEPC